MSEITPTQKVAIDVQNALDTIKFLAEALDPEDGGLSESLPMYGRRAVAAILKGCEEKLKPVLELI
jgi:hypothetical protein